MEEKTDFTYEGVPVQMDYEMGGEELEELLVRYFARRGNSGARG